MKLGLRVGLTLLLALGAALVCVELHTPIPWMLGPLLMTASAPLLGVPVYSAMPLRNTGQWVIGTALGLYFTPAVGSLVASLWGVIALGGGWGGLRGGGRLLQRCLHRPRLVELLSDRRGLRGGRLVLQWPVRVRGV